MGHATMKNRLRDAERAWLLHATPWLLVGLLLASFALRLYRLGDQSVWWDEGLAAWAARQSPSEIAAWTSADVHPPLYFWVLRFWRLLAGETEFALRALSVGVGVLTVTACYRLGFAVGGPWTGLGAGMLVGIARFDVQWSQEMRMYALAALFAALSLWAAIRFWRCERWKDAATYVLLMTAGLYTLYLYAAVLAVTNLVWLLALVRSRQRGRTLSRWAVAQVSVLALVAPWLAYALPRMPTWSSASPVSLSTFVRIYWTVLTVGNPTNVEQYAWLTLPLLVVFASGLAVLCWEGVQDGRTWGALALLLTAVLLPAGVVYLVSLPRSMFYYAPQLAPRYLLVFAPAFYVLAAWGAAALGGRIHSAVGVISLASFGIAATLGLTSYYPGRILRDDYRSLAATLRAYEREGDAVLLYTDKDWPIFAYHYSGPWTKVPHAQPITAEWAEVYLSPLWEQYEGIWLVVTPYARINDPEGWVSRWLEERAHSVDEHRFADKVLRLYARTGARASQMRTLATDATVPRLTSGTLASGLQLAGYERWVDRFVPGDTMHLFLYWQRSAGPSSALGFRVVLVDPGGRELKAWTQVAPWQGPAPQMMRQQIDVVLPPDAPPGRYRLLIQAADGDAISELGDLCLVERAAKLLDAGDVSIPSRYQVDLDHGVRLLGYDVTSTPVARGDTLNLTLYWQAQSVVEQRYKVFTHVLGETFNAQTGSFIWGQQDNEPVSDTRPTSTWRVGEVIVDSYGIAIDPAAPGGDYTVEIGMYDPATGTRVPVLDRKGSPVADHIVLFTLQVMAQ